MLDANFEGSQSVIYRYKLNVEGCSENLSINIEYKIYAPEIDITTFETFYKVWEQRLLKDAEDADWDINKYIINLTVKEKPINKGGRPKGRKKSTIKRNAAIELAYTKLKNKGKSEEKKNWKDPNTKDLWKQNNLTQVFIRLTGWQLQSFKESYDHKVKNGKPLNNKIIEKK